MSRAFVKEPDGDESLGELPDLPLSRHPNYVTPSGLKQLQERLEQTQAEEARIRAEIEPFAAKPALAHVARDARYLKARIESAILIEPADQPQARVAFGATVRLADEDDQEHRFWIVGEDEADPAHGAVSWISPLARALHEAQVGDLITWRRPNGDLELEVLEISYEAG